MTVGVGVVGYGLSARSLHVPLITAEPGLELRAVVSHHDGPPGVAVVPTLDALLTDPGVELVVVAVPNAAHHDVCAAALDAGRHVVVDKPFTVTVAEADDLIALATRRSRCLSVFSQRRYDADFLTVRRYVEAGEVGVVSTFVGRYDRFRPGRPLRWVEEPGRGTGVLYDLVSHLIDQAMCLFGAPDTVWADLGVQLAGAVDYAHLVLRYGSLRVLLHAGSLVLAPGPKFEAHGDRGSFVQDKRDGRIGPPAPGDPGPGDDDRPGALTVVRGGLPLPTFPVRSEPGDYGVFYREMAAAVRGEGPVPIPAEQARDVVRVIELAMRSSAEGRVLPY